MEPINETGPVGSSMLGWLWSQPNLPPCNVLLDFARCLRSSSADRAASDLEALTDLLQASKEHLSNAQYREAVKRLETTLESCPSNNSHFTNTHCNLHQNQDGHQTPTGFHANQDKMDACRPEGTLGRRTRRQPWRSISSLQHSAESHLPHNQEGKQFSRHQSSSALDQLAAPHCSVPALQLEANAPTFTPFSQGQAPFNASTEGISDPSVKLLRLVSSSGFFELPKAQAAAHELNDLIRTASADAAATLSSLATATTCAQTHPATRSLLSPQVAPVEPIKRDWLDLPLDIWLNILDQLPYSTKQRCRLSCTLLRLASNLTTTALDLGDPRSTFFFGAPTNLPLRRFATITHARTPSLNHLPTPSALPHTNLTTLELKTLTLDPTTLPSLLPFTNLHTLKATRAPNGVPFANLPRSLTTLHIRSVPPNTPLLPPANLAPEFTSLAHVDLPISFPAPDTHLASLAALPALTSLGTHGRINIDGWPSGMLDLARLTGLTRLSCSAAFNSQLAHLSALSCLQQLELFAKDGPKEEDWNGFLVAIPAITSLTLHNAPTPALSAPLLPHIAEALPALQALHLTSANTQFEHVVQLPALGDASGLTALTRLDLRQSTMQDPALQNWLEQLTPTTAPPALQSLDIEGRAGGYDLAAVTSCPQLHHLGLVFPEQALDEAAAAAVACLGTNSMTSLRLRTLLSPPAIFTDLCTQLPRVSRLDLSAPRLSRMALEELARALHALPSLESMTLMMSVAAIGSLAGINSLHHLSTLTSLDTLQLRCCNSAELLEVQQRVGQLASHPSLSTLQVQLRSNLIKRPASCNAELAYALKTVALGTGARVSILGFK